MNIQPVRFHVDGLSPLMCANPASMGRPIPRIPNSLSAEEKLKREAAERVAQSAANAYVNNAQQYVHPMVAFRKCIVAAAGGKAKIAKRSARLVVTSGVLLADGFDDFIIHNGDGNPAKHYEIDSRPVVVNRQRVIRHRPKFWPWSGDVVLGVDLDLFDGAAVEPLLNEGGSLFGVGEYRPERGGWFGRFTAKLVGAA